MAGGYAIETRVQTDVKVVVVMPACKLDAKLDELAIGGHQMFELHVIAGAETVTACRNPISKCTETVICTCPDFRLALTRAEIAAGPTATFSPSLEAKCVHTLTFCSEYAPVHFPTESSANDGTPAFATSTTDELAHRIITGRISPGDTVDEVTEFKGKHSVTQFFSVVDDAAFDHLTGTPMPTVAIVTGTPRLKAGSSDTEYVLECRSQICGKRASATLDKPSDEAPATAAGTPGEPNVSILTAQDGSKVCRHIRKVYDSATARGGGYHLD